MPDDAHEDLLEIAKRIAIEAGEAVLTVYDKGEFDAYQKEDDSPVTSADYLANDIITKQLSEATPDIPILSEENKHASLEERKDWPRYWLIDPIDGTQEFIARSGDFASRAASPDRSGDFASRAASPDRSGGGGGGGGDSFTSRPASPDRGSGRSSARRS